MVRNIKCPKLFSPKDISSCLNNYFTTIVSKLAYALPKTSFPKPVNTVFTCSLLLIKPIIDEDIIRDINLLDNSKCDHAYDILVKFLKHNTRQQFFDKLCLSQYYNVFLCFSEC